eukprot:scaffold487_cov344-Prasinococcus_capsulatus_cf.AAC.19
MPTLYREKQVKNRPSLHLHEDSLGPTLPRPRIFFWPRPASEPAAAPGGRGPPGSATFELRPSRARGRGGFDSPHIVHPVIAVHIVAALRLARPAPLQAPLPSSSSSSSLSSGGARARAVAASVVRRLGRGALAARAGPRATGSSGERASSGSMVRLRRLSRRLPV